MFFKAQQNGNESQESAVNIPDLLDRCLGDALFAESLLTRFEETARANIQKISDGLAGGDATQVAEAAHALKGAAGVVSADALRRLTEEVERSGKAGDLASAQPRLPQLQAEMQRYLDSLPGVLETLRSNPAA